MSEQEVAEVSGEGAMYEHLRVLRTPGGVRLVVGNIDNMRGESVTLGADAVARLIGALRGALPCEVGQQGGGEDG